MSNRNMKKPACLKEMISICEKLSNSFSLVRIDLYTNGAKFFVGEITHCSESATGKFMPRESEYIASEMLFSD